MGASEKIKDAAATAKKDARIGAERLAPVLRRMARKTGEALGKAAHWVRIQAKAAADNRRARKAGTKS